MKKYSLEYINALKNELVKAADDGVSPVTGTLGGAAAGGTAGTLAGFSHFKPQLENKLYDQLRDMPIGDFKKYNPKVYDDIVDNLSYAGRLAGGEPTSSKPSLAHALRDKTKSFTGSGGIRDFLRNLAGMSEVLDEHPGLQNKVDDYAGDAFYDAIRKAGVNRAVKSGLIGAGIGGAGLGLYGLHNYLTKNSSAKPMKKYSSEYINALKNELVKVADDGGTPVTATLLGSTAGGTVGTMYGFDHFKPQLEETLKRHLKSMPIEEFEKANPKVYSNIVDNLSYAGRRIDGATRSGESSLARALKDKSQTFNGSGGVKDFLYRLAGIAENRSKEPGLQDKVNRFVGESFDDAIARAGLKKAIKSGLIGAGIGGAGMGLVGLHNYLTKNSSAKPMKKYSSEYINALKNELVEHSRMEKKANLGLILKSLAPTAKGVRAGALLGGRELTPAGKVEGFHKAVQPLRGAYDFLVGNITKPDSILNTRALRASKELNNPERLMERAKRQVMSEYGPNPTEEIIRNYIPAYRSTANAPSRVNLARVGVGAGAGAGGMYAMSGGSQPRPRYNPYNPYNPYMR